MSVVEKLVFLIGIFVVLFGFIMVIGAIGIMTDDEREDSVVEWLFWMVSLGFVPMAAGVLVCRKMRQRGRKRESEVHERTILHLAKDNGGRLTITDVAMNMSIPAAEAKKLLDRCHLDNLADIEASESGVVTYLFKTG